MKRAKRAIEPDRYRADLEAVVREIADCVGSGSFDSNALHGILRRHPRDGRGFFSRAEIIAGYRRLRSRAENCGSESGIAVSEHQFVSSVQRRPVRTRSGVTPLTVLTKPFPCPGQCVFCPNDVRMPKSYLADEPGAQRAATNRFDPYLQTWNRLAAFHAIGHPTDKVELIVLGGTWSFYPERYQIWFAKRCFEALNDYGAGIDGRADVRPSVPRLDGLPERIDARDHVGNPYNRLVGGFLDEHAVGGRLPAAETASWSELSSAQVANEGASCRCVGLVFETRPDHVSAEEVVRIRRLGATKVQLGIQSLDDAVLSANQRGHDVRTTRKAIRLLRGAGFKVHAHWMPNLLGSTPERDRADFARLWSDPGIRPDELKIYPCSLIESAELMRFYESGAWRPYDHDELLALLADALASVPRYCRVTRVIRDISSDDIVAGNKRTNFRQLAEAEVSRRGDVCRDIRSREIGAARFEQPALELVVTEYETSVGTECFFEYVTPDDRILAFLRLSLPERTSAVPLDDIAGEPGLSELAGSAMIREVHVYGASVGLGQRIGEQAQHRGLGTRLVGDAVRRAGADGFENLAVISAVGTRRWYRRLGFADGPLYQHRRLRPVLDSEA
jgi:elongator complex protein 3